MHDYTDLDVSISPFLTFLQQARACAEFMQQSRLLHTQFYPVSTLQLLSFGQKAKMMNSNMYDVKFILKHDPPEFSS